MNNLRYLLICIALTCTACKTTGEREETDQRKLDLASEQFARKDYESAAITLLPLVREGNPDAEYSLGYMYYYGLGVPKNMNYGRQLMQASAEQGDDRAISALTLLSRQEATLGPANASRPHTGRQVIKDID